MFCIFFKEKFRKLKHSSLFLSWTKFDDLLCKQSHVDERKDFVASMYFDSMQMHVKESLINPGEDFDGNHWFVRPKSMEIPNDRMSEYTNLNDCFDSI